MPEDIEMNRMEPAAAGKSSAPMERDQEPDTEYKPINWRKIFLSPKYIRMRNLAPSLHVH